jgi:2-oxoglutarate dehydrogenase E2 component (dihydrolipoamide succinyltransferase)
MIVEVRLPQWGMGVTDGTIIEWLYEVGDEVTEGEPICEVEVSKTTDYIVAPASGVLAEILVKEEENVPVFELLAKIES